MYEGKLFLTLSNVVSVMYELIKDLLDLEAEALDMRAHSYSDS
jgi:hypothetical protein